MSNNNNNNNNNNYNDDNDNQHKRMRWIIVVILVVWFCLGLAAYVYSFECTREIYSGGSARKIVMFILALLFGPLWWLILPFAKSEGYCKLNK
jgi:cell division protein FtsI/penicillin-binding protein 2